MSTFLRRLEILNYLASTASTMGTEQILNHLLDGGYLDPSDGPEKSLLRIVQRDMNALLGELDEDGEASNEFGLCIEPSERRAQRWYIDPYASALKFDFEKMPAMMALAMSLTQKHLTHVLPSSVRDALSSSFDAAHDALSRSDKRLSTKHYQRLKDSVEFFQRGQTLRAPEFRAEFLDRIYQAILHGKRIVLTYQKAKGIAQYDLHPLGVAILLPKLYLIAIKDEDFVANDEFDPGRYRSFLVHKIVDIELSSKSARIPEGFSLKDYLEQGNMDVVIDRQDHQHYQLELQLSVYDEANILADLKQSPISYDQTLQKAGDKDWRLIATVKRTVQLRNWLLSLGSSARVLSPERIREDILTELDAIRTQYD